MTGLALTSRSGVDVERHVLLLRIRDIQQVRPDWSLCGVCTEVQHYDAQHSENDAYWLSTFLVAKQQT